MATTVVIIHHLGNLDHMEIVVGIVHHLDNLALLRALF